MTLLEPTLPFKETTQLRPIDWRDLPGWECETFKDIPEALESSRQYLQAFGPSQLLSILQALSGKGLFLKKAIEKVLSPYQVVDKNQEMGLFTGYYEPVVRASLTPHGPYKIPIYKRPASLLVVEDLGYFCPDFKGHRIAGISEDGTLKPFYESSKLWQGVLDGQGLEIAWADSLVDVYYLHIQGSGLLALDDGSDLRVTYDGTNGHVYSSLRQILIDEGLLSPECATMTAIRDILDQHPLRCQDLLSKNKSYVFFKVLNQSFPYSRLGVPLVANRSLAVDPLYVPFGTPLWVHTPDHKAMMFAQDLGVAIKGPIRGDIFCGTGAGAGQKAGSLKTDGRFYMLLPK